MNNATLNIEQYTMKDLYDVFDMSTTDTYTRDYVTKKYNTLGEIYNLNQNMIILLNWIWLIF